METTVDDFVWEHHASWDGTEACYAELREWIRRAKRTHPTSKLHAYAVKRQEEQVKVRRKLVDLRCRSPCRDAFDKFIAQRDQLVHLYMIVGVWLTC